MNNGITRRVIALILNDNVYSTLRIVRSELRDKKLSSDRIVANIGHLEVQRAIADAAVQMGRIIIQTPGPLKRGVRFRITLEQVERK